MNPLVSLFVARRYGGRAPSVEQGGGEDFDLAALRTTPTGPATGIQLATLPNNTETSINEGGSDVWEVVSSDHADSGIQALVGNTYNSLRNLVIDVVAAQNAAGGLDVKIDAPKGREIRVDQNNSVAFEGRGTCSFVGDVDGNGEPRFMLKNAGVSHFLLGAHVDTADGWAHTHCRIENVRMGLYPNEIPADPTASTQTGDAGVYHGSGGAFDVVNCVFAGIAQDGIESVGGNAALKTTYGKVRVYDSELYWCGATPLKHNIYVHELSQLLLVRTLSYRAKAGHCLKVDRSPTIVIDSFIDNLSPNHPGWAPGYSSPVNYTRTGDIYFLNSVIAVDELSGASRPNSAIIDSARKYEHGYGGFKFPLPFFQADGIAYEASLVNWTQGSLNIATHWGGDINETLSGGETTILFRRLARFGSQYPAGGSVPTDSSPFDEGVTYDLRYVDNNGNAVDIIGASVQSQDAGSLGQATFSLAGASPSSVPSPGTSRYAACVIKQTGTAWDTPELEPKFWNRNDPDYAWTKVNDGTGLPDHSKRDLLYRSHLTDTMILMGVNAKQVMERQKEGVNLWYGKEGSEVEAMAHPPMNRPQGATAEWPDIGGASVWGDVLYPNPAESGNDSIIGDPGSENDLVDIAPSYFRNVGVRPRSGASPITLDGVRFNNPPWVTQGADTGADPFVSYLDASGALVQMGNEQPFPLQKAQPLVNAVATAGATSIEVDNATNIASGDGLQVRFTPKRGVVQMLATTVQGVSGSTITLADPLPRDLAGGEEVAVFTLAGAKPSWWNDGVS